MLYSSDKIQINKNKSVGYDSKLRTHQVFMGDYWDEFGLLSYPEIKKALVLGCGSGSCIRPLLSNAPKMKITLVDNDADALKKCTEIYSKYFPEINFEVINQDASFVESFGSNYDLIIVDTYTDKGYTSFLNFSGYFEKLEHALSDSGILAINCFTVPTFLSSGISNAETFFIEILSKSFSKIRTFPFRRNITILASKHPIPNERVDNSRLNEIDSIVFESQIIRKKNREYQVTNPLNNRSVKCLPLFEQIGREMNASWIEHDSLRKEKTIPTSSYIHSILTNSHLHPDHVTDFFNGHNDPLVDIPVIMGSLTSDGSNNSTVFLTSILEVIHEVKKRNLQSFYHFYLPQLVSIAAHMEVSDKDTLKKITDVF